MILRNFRFLPTAAIGSDGRGLPIFAEWPVAAVATRDPRWPAIAARLTALREQDRYTVRIVDADCGVGAVLLHAVRYARQLGFTAIEGHGVHRSPALIRRAQAAARCHPDPAIGVVFEVADLASAILAEDELPADLLLWHGPHPGDAADLVRSVSRAARVVIADPVAQELAA